MIKICARKQSKREDRATRCGDCIKEREIKINVSRIIDNLRHKWKGQRFSEW